MYNIIIITYIIHKYYFYFTFYEFCDFFICINVNNNNLKNIKTKYIVEYLFINKYRCKINIEFDKFPK